jgi:hypothetical protein
MLDLSGLAGHAATLHLSTDGTIEATQVTVGQPLTLSLPAHSCALLVISQ